MVAVEIAPARLSVDASGTILFFPGWFAAASCAYATAPLPETAGTTTVPVAVIATAAPAAIRVRIRSLRTKPLRARPEALLVFLVM
ncbi:Uncharacterised protein [Corynebacterium renale]|nr:Uncharacterised protein [Corynebacterium renale]